jgi:hypothetical protein
MKKLLLTTAAVFALTVQAGSLSIHNWNNGSSNSFKFAIKAAETGYKANLAVNMAWRDTRKMITEAKKLHKAGKNVAAIALANKAHKQTVNATAQTALVESAGPRF